MHSMTKWMKVMTTLALVAGFAGFVETASAADAKQDVHKPQLRIVPVVAQDGRQTAFRIVMIDPDSVFARYDLKVGDELRNVNGTPMDGPHKLLDAYKDLERGANSAVVLGLLRDGKEVVLVYGAGDAR